MRSAWRQRGYSAVLALVLGLVLTLLPGSLLAGSGGGGHGLEPWIWGVLAVMVLAAKLGGEVAVRLKQPPVLGELLAGILLGNLGVFDVQLFETAANAPAIAFAAELGVVLLLFSVGLESTLAQMRTVAPISGKVAILGVVAPMFLGLAVTYWMLPEAPLTLDLFVGATLCATSVGITARVLSDVGAGNRPEARVILGAAVLDDVLGLMVLAVVSAVAAQGAIPGWGELGKIIGMAGGFLAGALLVGILLAPRVYRVASRLRTEGVLGAVSIAMCFSFAWLSGAAGLAAIVGAFAAGLILDEIKVQPFGGHAMHRLEESVRPVVSLFAPIFFVRTGMQVTLEGASLDTLLLALVLTVVAIFGKVVAGLGVKKGSADRLTVGLGMVPRGEVGLIFADAGSRIVTNGVPLISPPIYVAIVLMVLFTTLVSPPALAWRLRSLPPEEPSSTP